LAFFKNISAWKTKGNEKVKDWSAHIITHFWHCSSACRKDETTSDEEALKTMKVCLFFYHQ
jgi:hypothetical protein